jgi:hypothetical protein
MRHKKDSANPLGKNLDNAFRKTPGLTAQRVTFHFHARGLESRKFVARPLREQSVG